MATRKKKKDLSAVLQQAKAGHDSVPTVDDATPSPAPPATSEAPPPVNAAPPVAKTAQTASPPTTHEPAAPPPPADAKRATTRQGKKAIITYLPPEVHTELKIMAARQGTTIQELGERAFALLFEEQGM